MDKYMFAFGGGSRACIGRNFAMAAMSKLVPEFLRQFEIELVNPNTELKLDNHWYYPAFGKGVDRRFIKPDYVWVKVRPRV